MEVWKFLQEWPRYEVSSHGRVRRGARILKQSNRGDGRPSVDLYYGHGKRRKMNVHRLVLTTFSPTTDPTLLVLHSDGDCQNNHLSNLRWGTHRDNHRDSVRHRTFKLPTPRFGDENPWCKISDDGVALSDAYNPDAIGGRPYQPFLPDEPQYGVQETWAQWHGRRAEHERNWRQAVEADQRGPERRPSGKGKSLFECAEEPFDLDTEYRSPIGRVDFPWYGDER